LQAKVTVGLATIVVVTSLASACIISSLPEERIISISVIALGLSAGMIGGTVLSPSNNKESKRFTSFGQALTAFVSGYLASKLNPVIDSMIATNPFTHPVDIFRLLAFAATLLAVGKATFSCRSNDH
jgi:hypothetical protein